MDEWDDDDDFFEGAPDWFCLGLLMVPTLALCGLAWWLLA